MEKSTAGMEKPKAEMEKSSKQFHMTRIILRCKSAYKLTKVSSDLLRVADGKGIMVKGPAILPTKDLKIRTERDSSGKETEIWEITEMPKRCMDLLCTKEMVEKMITMVNEPAVQIEFRKVYSGPWHPAFGRRNSRDLRLEKGLATLSIH